MMGRIFDYTAEANDGDYDELPFDMVSLVWIHRIGPGIGLNVVEISKRFQTDLAKYTGGNMPYTVVNTLEGQIQQGLAFDERGAHARRFGNMHGYGFAQIGDFNREPPKAIQWESAVDFCVELVPSLAEHRPDMFLRLPESLRRRIPIVGHGEVPAAIGKNSGKEQPNGSDACPGKHWNMDEFRQDVKRILRDRACERLSELGAAFTKAA